MSHDSEMSTDPNDEDLNFLMNIPDEPSTSHSTSQQKCDRIVGRQVQKGRIFYEVLPASQFGFATSIFEDPSRIAPYNIAVYEFGQLNNRHGSVFPIEGTDPNPIPVSIRWFGKLEDQRYFLIEYDNQTHRLVEMNDSSDLLDPITRQFVCDNLELHLQANKIDICGNEWPVDPINFTPYEPIDCQPGPSTIINRSLNREKVCSCSIGRFFQRAKPKLCLSKLEAFIRRKKPQKPNNRKKGLQSTGSDSSDEEPPKKFGRHM